MSIKQFNEGNNQDCGDNLKTKLTTVTLQGEGGGAKTKPLERIAQHSRDCIVKKLEMLM